MATYSDTVTEAGSAVDTVTFVFSNTVTEVVSAADALSAIFVTYKDVVEYAAATDQANATNIIFDDKVIETLLARDTTFSPSVFSDGVTESISTVDTFDELTLAYIVESISTRDTVTMWLSSPPPQTFIDPNWLQAIRDRGLRVLNATYTRRSHPKKWVYPK